MTRALAALAVTAAAVLATPATAQETDVGGDVPSILELEFEPVAGFARFPAGPGEHELVVRARVTTTETGGRLSVADGDVATAGRRLGRMANGSAMLRQPLEARVGAAAFQPLDTTIDPVLAAFRDPLANARLNVRLRQRIDPGERPSGRYAKTVLVTLSSTAP